MPPPTLRTYRMNYNHPISLIDAVDKEKMPRSRLSRQNKKFSSNFGFYDSSADFEPCAPSFHSARCRRFLSMGSASKTHTFTSTEK